MKDNLNDRGEVRDLRHKMGEKESGRTDMLTQKNTEKNKRKENDATKTKELEVAGTVDVHLVNSVHCEKGFLVIQ